ncbi:MAG: hypothetical protein ACRDTT_25355 [Pseudonocardiaceae bacterium]
MTCDGTDFGGIDIHGARVYAILMTTRFRGITIREGMLIEGPAGRGEFCPFREYGDRAAAGWLATPVDGYLPVPHTPPAPAPALLDTYELTDQKQAAWWRDRLNRVYSERTRITAES